ncbi:DUF5691 domain-containing protein [Nocardiopsis oceani]
MNHPETPATETPVTENGAGHEVPAAPSWESLVSTALVGTARRAVPTSAAPTPTGPSEAAGPSGTAAPPESAGLPERYREGAPALLALAAVETVRARAGYTAHTAEPVTPDAPDPRPSVGAAATHRLDVILADRPELLPEWLDHAVRGGRRVSHAQIPELLERASRDSELRPAAALAAGGRGAWLAAFNRAWAFAAREPLPTDRFTQRAWDEGTPADRRRALFALRATDPAAARDLLAAAWPRESKGDERRGLLESLRINLGHDDEEVLDRALDDRNANVRGLALALLTRLPDSAHAHRLRGYLREHVRHDPSPRCPVEVTDVDVRRTDLLRDLALAAPNGGGRSHDERRASHAEHRERSRVLVTHTPLDVWTGLLDTGPEGVLALAAGEAELRETLTDAACLQRDPAWVRAVLDHPGTGLPRMVGSGVQDPRRQRIRALLAPLPATERCERVLAAIGTAGDQHNLGQTLLAIGAPWTRELSEEVARRLAVRVDQRDSRGYRFLCEAAAEHMPPEHLDLLPPEPPQPEEGPAYLRLRDTLRFRLDMHREL